MPAPVRKTVLFANFVEGEEGLGRRRGGGGARRKFLIAWAADWTDVAVRGITRGSGRVPV
jgi:hypothetical protein